MSIKFETMQGNLLEREQQLAALGDYAAEAASGHGRLVLVTGEAGIGKTSLVDAFRAAHPDLHWLWAACDGGFTPRPLAPVHELAYEAGGRLRDLCRGDTDRNELFAEFLSVLEAGPPTGVVLEDVHWADEATLDWLSHVSRRLNGLPALVLATYRDDEPDDGLLAAVMGRLATHGSTRRLKVPPLTRAAVVHLAGDRDGHEVHALTGGNPFYVGEVVALENGAVPPSVADVVRARVLRHSPPAQRILAGAAVLGRPASAAMLAAVTGVSPAAVDECVTSGTLLADHGLFGFRHELTRRAVEQAVPAVQAAELHRIALTALEREGADAAELTHHALGADDVEAILRHAPRAGRAAAAASAHREAIVQFRRALEHDERLAPADRADLLEALAQSLSTRDQWAEAEEPWRQVIALRRQLADPVALSRSLRYHGMCLWRLCRTEEFLEARDESFELMQAADDSAERALSYFNRTNGTDLTPAERRTILDECSRIAKDLDDHALIGRALMGKAFIDGQSGIIDFELLEEALEHALLAADAYLASAVYTNLYEVSVDMLRLDAYADRYDEALTYALEHEQHTYSLCIRGARVIELLRRGRNREAADLALLTLGETMSPINRMYLLLGLARAGFRLGRPESREWLEELWSLARGNDETFWMIQVATATAEAAWLVDDAGLVTDEVLAIHRRGLTDDPWMHGELTTWMRRLGHPLEAVQPHKPPTSLELAGDFAAAADAWHDLGCPFEEAVALTWTGETDAMRRALEIFTQLDAGPAAGHVRRLLEEHGVRVPAPRKPRATTVAHPAGLTAREAEVLDLLRDGLTNAQIADRLVLSPRTVDHHVSAVLAKLGVGTRAEASERARAFAEQAPASQSG